MKPGTQICLGFDGSETDDYTVIRAETVDGFQFTPKFGPNDEPTIWDPSKHGGRIPRLEVAAAIDSLFRRYRVRRMYCDPWKWQTEVETWAMKHGPTVVLPWETNRVKQMHHALERFRTDLENGALTHDDCPITADHMANARKVARPGERYILSKPAGAEHQKIDSAVTSVICHEAAADARAEGWGVRDAVQRTSTAMYGFN